MPPIPTERVVLGLPGRPFFALLVLFAIAAFVYSMSRRIRVLLAGRPDDRFTQIPLRVKKMLEYAFVQRRMFRDPYAGFFHILIFGGFVVLTVRSIALVFEGLVPGFVLLPGRAGDLYTLVKDVFEVLTLLGVTLAVARRAFARPARLDLSMDAWLILFLIALLMATDLVAAGAQAALAPGLQTAWAPAVMAIARWLGSSGASPARLHALYDTCWWVHLSDLLFFGNYLPYSKHFHIITSVPNIFFMNLAPMGRLKTVDLENSERFGASRVEDLTWKSMLDGYTCTECGRCREVCPTALTGKPLDPKIFIGNVRDAVYEATPGILAETSGRGGDGAGEGHARKDLIGGWISEDTIWACTMCGFCTTACPVFIVPAVDKIVEMRRYLVLDKAEFPKEVQNAFRGMETNGNPWNIAAASRADWAKGLSVPVVTMGDAEGKAIEVLFWVGCAGSYEDRAKRVSTALVEILDAAGVSFAILGTEETCTGDSARRMGNEYLFQMLAQQNVETLNGHKVRKIVTNCPHCMNCLKNEYGDFGGHYEVVHGSELVAELIAAGRVKLTTPIPDTITFHDPCYLGRYNGGYEAPRQILRAIPGLELKELERSRERGLCCGAGGGRMWMEEKLGTRINQARMQEIAAAGTGSVGVSCPFCMVMIGNAKDEIGVATVPFDVLELARKSMSPGPA